jgi:hypothetical protein
LDFATKYTIIDLTEKLKLEEEDNTFIPFYKAELTDITFQINEWQYYQGFLEYLNQQSNNSLESLDQCLCQSIKNPVFCEKCQHVWKDWTIYNAFYICSSFTSILADYYHSKKRDHS